jgi:hypothetical protein
MYIGKVTINRQKKLSNVAGLDANSVNSLFCLKDQLKNLSSFTFLPQRNLEPLYMFIASIYKLQSQTKMS